MLSHLHLPRLEPSTRRDVGFVLLLALLWVFFYANLQLAADWLTYTLLGLDPASRFGAALNFFLYDVPKILLLLSGMIFLITLLRTFVTAEQTRRLLGGKREGVGNIMAALVGVITPFCSCSAVPLFIGFVESGIPLGVTLSFLIAAPMVNEVALVMLMGMFGAGIAALYLVSGLVVAIVAGVIIGRLHLENEVEAFVYQVKSKQTGQMETKRTWSDRFEEAFDKAREIVGKVWLFVVIGIALGAFLHGFVPEDALVNIMGANAWWSVPVAVVIGVPLYSNAAGVMPVVSVLLDKGAALGTVLAFMMSVVALSLPEIIILRKVLKPRLIAIFVGVVALSILITGYLFNLIV